ncbi:MAG: tetratricopeptide repeat protein [Bacteroidota bacterium]
MGISKDPSVILLTQVVHAQHKTEIYESVLEGSRVIDQALGRAETKRCCQVIREGISPSNSLYEVLQKHMDSNVSVIHISGTPKHITESEFSFISNVLSQFPSLRVVFLEGCSTLSFTKNLLLKDVPIVVSSPFHDYSQPEPSIAEVFYAQLALGDSLKEAIDEIIYNFEGVNLYPATYDFENDQLRWGNLELTPDEEPPGGLYLLQDHRHQLNWRLPYSERLVQPVVEMEVPEKRSNFSRVAAISTAAVLGMVMIVGGYFFYNSWTQSKFISDNCHFSQDSLRLNTVFLPFYDKESGKMIRKGLSKQMEAKSRLLSRYPGVLTKYLAVKNQGDLYRIIDQWLLDCNTDLLVWGEFEEKGDSMVNLSVNFIMPELRRDSLVQGRSSLDLPSDAWNSIRVDTLVQDLVYETLGQGFFEFKNYKEAVKLYKQVSFTSPELISEVNLKMAQAYSQMEILDTARQYFDDVLRFNPDNAPAYHGLAGILVREKEFESALENYWMAEKLSPNFLEATYNKGLVHFRLDQFEEAINSMNQVLELDPRNARAKGILSAIYAKEENEELFYHFLEEALKEGLNIRSLTTYTEVGSYQAEKRFRSLVEKY